MGNSSGSSANGSANATANGSASGGTRDLGIRIALALLLLIDAVVVHFAVRDAFRDPHSDHMLGATAIAVAVGLLAIAVLARPGRVTFALAKGVALSVICIVIVYGLLFQIAASFESGVSAAAMETTRRWMLLAVVIQAAVLIIAHIFERPSLLRSIVSAVYGSIGVYAIGWIILVLSAFAEPFLEYSRTAPRIAAHVTLRDAISRVQACAHRYAVAQPARGYPPNLGAMGPAGTGCLDESFVVGKVGDVSVAYVSDPADATGRVPGFVVTTRGITGDDGTIQVGYGDTSGFVRAGADGVAPESLPLSDDAMPRLRALRNCAERYRELHPNEGYPRSLEAFGPLTEDSGREASLFVGCESNLTREVSNASLNQFTHLVYTPLGSNQPVSDYVVELRPIVYGARGIRSYRATARGPVRVTLDDRPATDADPVMRECDYDLSDFTCAPPVGGIAPVAELVVNERIQRDVPFVVAVRDLREASVQRAAPYRVLVECNVRGAVHERWQPPVAADFGTAREARCLIERGKPFSDGDQLTMRAWVLDRAGSMTILEVTRTYTD
jgi:hypothetical protein